MIDYGYRIYDGLDGRLHFDQIVAGRVYPLQPTDADEKMPRGFYAPDFTYLGDDGISDVADWTADVDWPDAWEESQHPRGQPENKGEFAKGGGGGGGKGESGGYGKSYVRAGEAGEGGGGAAAGAQAKPSEAQKKQAKEYANKIAGKAFKTVKGMLGAEDYEIVHEHFKAAKSKPKERAKIGGYLRQMAKAGKNLAKAHLKEEAHHAKHAVGALRAMATGNKPTKQQAMGLFSYGARALMITGSMALGDPTGHSGALAATFAEDAVHHVLLEHAVKLFVGGGFGMIKGAVAKPERDADPGGRPEPPDDDDTDVDTSGDPGEDDDPEEMSDDDAALLQKFLECLADTVEDMTEEDAMRVLAQGETPDDAEDGDDDPDGDDDGEPQAKGEESDEFTKDVDPWWTADIEWDPQEHPREPGGSERGGRFTAGGGGGGGGGGQGEAGRGGSEGGGEGEGDEEEGGAEGYAFVSPSVEEHLDFSAAAKGLKSERQKLLATTSRDIDERLNLHGHSIDAIGAWSDGAENSMVTRADGVSWELLELAVAMKAFLANQKDALVFQQQDDGKAQLFHFEAKGNLDKIHQDLLEDGVAFHSLVPTKDGATVFAVDAEGSGDMKVALAVKKAAERYGSEVTARPGKAKFLVGDTTGTAEEQRHKARLAYGNIIKKSGVQGAQELWARVRPTYKQAFNVTEFPKTTTKTPLPGSKGHPALISSREPSAVDARPGDKYRRADLKGMEEDPETFKFNMGLLREARAYPNFLANKVAFASPKALARIAIDHAKANLRFLYDNAPEEVRKQGPLWYEGAHNMAVAAAKKWNIPLQSAAGVYAALSPQKLWDQNVKLGDKVMSIYKEQQNTPWSPEMTATARRIWKEKDRALLDRIGGKTLAELQLPAEKAMWIRTYDEAHDPEQHFERLSPDGKALGTWFNLDGTPAKNAWQNTGAIANAIVALESNGNRERISQAMGARHKVRSFYNNILDPHSANNDVTMDTHAVGAVLLRPETQQSISVMQSLATGPKDAKKAPPGWRGASSSNVTGSTGTYPIWADAYRELADELGIEPRVLQSVTWVAKRNLFDDRMTKATRAAVEKAWADYHDANGRISLAETQRKVFELAGGMDKPPPGLPAPPKEKKPKMVKGKK